MMTRWVSGGSSARRARAALGEEGGLAAVEFALILPVALLLISLIVYGGQIFSVQRKVSMGAMTVANIFAQANNDSSATLSAAELNQILSYPNLILYPYDSSAVQVVVSELKVTTTTNNGVPTATGAAQHSCGNANAIANNMIPPFGQTMPIDPSIAAAFTGSANSPPPANSYVVLGQVYFPFQPTGIFYSLGQVTLSDFRDDDPPLRPPTLILPVQFPQAVIDEHSDGRRDERTKRVRRGGRTYQAERYGLLASLSDRNRLSRFPRLRIAYSPRARTGANSTERSVVAGLLPAIRAVPRSRRRQVGNSLSCP